MPQIPLVDGNLERFNIGDRLYSGPQITVGNSHTTAGNRVTKLMLSEYLMSANATDYNAGITKRHLAVAWEDGTAANVTTLGADAPIMGMVVAGGNTIAGVAYESDVYDINETSAEGRPADVTVALGADLFICEYTGTAPVPGSVTATGKLVLSATAGLVQIPSTLAIADAVTTKAIAVDTTLKLVVVRL